MDGILSLLSNPTMLIVFCLILFGGQIKIGDKTLLQFLIDLLANLFKPQPTPTPAGTQYGGAVIDFIKGMFSNPMVLIVLVLGVMMLFGGGGGCKQTPAKDLPLNVVPASWGGYTGPAQVDRPRLQLVQRGDLVEPIVRVANPGFPGPLPWQVPADPTVLAAEPADVPPALEPAAAACCTGSCSCATTVVRTYRSGPRVGWWRAGPVRRVLSAPFRLLGRIRFRR